MTKPTGADLFWAFCEHLGTPYEYGGWDCSEAILQACKDLGVPFVDGSTAQKNATTPVPLETAPIGALGWRYGHDGLLDGAGGIAHAANKERGTVWDESHEPLALTYAGLIPGIDYTESENDMAGSNKAVAVARSAVGAGIGYSGMCEKFTRTCFGFPAKYGSAKLAYQASKRDGKITVSYNAPAGVPVFWDILSGTNNPFDHVAVSVGGGYCISTSAGPGRTVAKVKIETLTKAWGMRYLGWADVYHGQRVYVWPTKETGKASYPNAKVGASATALKSAWYRFLGSKGYTGSTTVRLQKWLNAGGENLKVDGNWGSYTTQALQRKLKRSYQKTESDNLLNPGPADGQRGARTKRAEAAYLNHLRHNV